MTKDDAVVWPMVMVKVKLVLEGSGPAILLEANNNNNNNNGAETTTIETAVGGNHR